MPTNKELIRSIIEGITSFKNPSSDGLDEGDLNQFLMRIDGDVWENVNEYNDKGEFKEG